MSVKQETQQGVATGGQVRQGASATGGQGPCRIAGIAGTGIPSCIIL